MPNRVRTSDKLKKVNSQPSAPKRDSHARQDVSDKVVAFKPKEVDMLPADWARPGCPTPYELSTTIQTCKRLWKLNKEALASPECDHAVTEHNIELLERMYLHLMDYLVED